MRRIRAILIAAVVAVAAAATLATPVFAQWPTTCVDLNDIVENHLGRDNNVGIYQRAFGDQAEAGCQGDHREDVRGVFGWAFDLAPSAPPPAVEASSLPLVDDALRSAAFQGETEQVRTLVAGGLNVNVRTRSNDSLLSRAVFWEHPAIVQILIDAGANVNAKDGNGDSVLHRAVFWEHPAIIQMLIDAGADVNAKGGNGDPLLHRAVFWEHLEIIQMLIDAGADVNAKNPTGDPVLHRAVFWGNAEIVQMLVDAGVDVDATDHRGRSALSRAQFHRHDEIVQILLAAPDVEPELGWPTTCIDLNDIVENHLGNDNNVGIYQRAFGDQAEAGCRGDHREDVRGVFAWAFTM